jgi:hypothetical protein
MSNAISLAKELQQMKAIDVIRNERVRSQFISVYNSIWKEGGENVYEREAIYFNQQLRDKDELRLCSGTSIFYAFIDLAVSHWLLVRKHCVIFLPVTAKWELIQTAKKFGKKYAVSLSPDMESWHCVQKLDRYAMPTIQLLSMTEIVLNMERRTE